MNQQNKTLTPSSQGSRELSDPGKRTRDLSSDSIETSGSMASEMVAAQTEAEVKAGFGIALRNPRNEEDARQNIVRSCKNLRFAEKALYKKPVGGKTMEGLSIRFAEEMLRNWGNVKIIQQVIYDDRLRRMIRVIAYDLQANLPYGEDILVEKTVERKKHC